MQTNRGFDRGRLARVLVLSLVSVFFLLPARQVQHERWPIKTSYGDATKNPKKISLDVLGKLPVPQGVTWKKYSDRLIPGTFGGYKEGDFVEMAAWLHLAAFSTDDSDYHLQVTGFRDKGDSCIIVEIPDPRNTASRTIKSHWQDARAFVESLCGGMRPSEDGTVFKDAIYVKVTGQLFYDASHKDPGSRGKGKMVARTSWEIHPVWTIAAMRYR